MGRVLTNNVRLSYCIETALGTAGTEWKTTEPNEINSYGAEITTVAREPISNNRQRRKGTVTDLDSAVEFTADLTLQSFRDFMSGFTFSTGINSDVTNIPSTAAETTGDSYTVSALTAAQADKFEINSLIWVNGGTNSANQGLKVVDADIATSATSISVEENLVDETASFRISFAGFRIDSTSTVTWTWDAGNNQATLASTGIGTTLQALGLIAGQLIHVGSVASVGTTTVTNAFENSAANDMFGYARTVSISADAIVFDKVDAALQFTDSTDPATDVDILFSEFFRNVPTNDSAYTENSYQFELEMPNLGTGGADQYQYAVGNYCNSTTFNLPLTDKATITYGFIGTDTENPVGSGSRKSGASTAINPSDTSAFNTSADIARLRITEVDEDGITTDFKSVALTLGNNVSPEKVLGTLGATYMNTGNFDVDLEAQLVFTNPLVINKIRDNETVTMDFIINNDNGVICVDIPSMTLGDGSLELPVNESVLINVTSQAFQDENLGTSVGISTISVPLPIKKVV